MKPATIALGLVAIALLAGGGYWLFRTSQIEAAYAEAAELCRVSPARGAVKIDVLDRLYGSAAQPKALRLSLSVCSLEASVTKVRALR